jgi:hypothetical protein
MSERPYYETRSGEIVVNDGWRRDCTCHMNPCDVTWHYVRSVPDESRWTPGDPYIEPPRTVK